MPQAVTVEELLNKKTPKTAVADLILDSDLADKWRALESRKERLESGLRVSESDERLDDLAKVKAEMAEIEPEVEESKRYIKFKAIGRKAFRELEMDHAATDDDRREARELGQDKPTWHMETFAPALLAASAVEPEISETEARKLYDSDDYNPMELHMMYLTALNVNINSNTVALGKD